MIVKLAWILILAVLFAAIFAVGAACAQTSSNDRRLIEEIITIGTRTRPHTATETPVPVDYFSAEAVESVNSSDLIDVVATLVPAFSLKRHAIADGGAFIRPNSLRGLDAHHTLVLVNGKRRHRGSLVRLGGFGSHGADLSGLPSYAVGSMEILRDGAAALYGSDAIAGVINFNLKESDDGFELKARYGGYEAGDGEELRVDGGAGFALGNGGFVHLSASFASVEPTSRSEAYDLAIGQSGITPYAATKVERTVDGVRYFGPDAFTYEYGENGEILQVLPVSDGVPDDLDRRFAENYHRIGGGRRFEWPAQIWGQPEREQWMLNLNAEWPLKAGFDLYSFGGYASRESTGGFFYRRPGVSQLLPVRLADGSIYDPRTSLYPSGFTPQFTGRVLDGSLATGVRGDLSARLGFDVSAAFGRNKIAYSITNTMNPSLGPETPTRFRPGDLTSRELALNADFTLDLGAVSNGDRHRSDGAVAGRDRHRWQGDRHLAFGFEYRVEGYEIGEGGEASYAIGPFARRDPFDLEITWEEARADPDDMFEVAECRIPGFVVMGALCPEGDPIHNALSVGSNGFPGYPSAFASDYERVSYGAYAEIESEFWDRHLLSLAVRYEDFEDFGEVGIGKLALRLALSDAINVRSSLGTGFRAPTPGQISTTNVSTRINSRGVPVAQGVFPSNHPASMLFGSKPLDAEDSWSMTVGVGVDLASGVSLTLDYYRIELENRIVLSSVFTLDDEDRRALEGFGVTGASDIAELRFFTNDVDTRTAGFDLVASYDFDSRMGHTTLRAAVNHNRTWILERGRFVAVETEFDLEHALPVVRGNLTVTHAWRMLELMLRARYYGKHRNAATGSLRQIQRFTGETMVDANLDMNLGERWSLRLGAENLFDTYPQRARYETCCGIVYTRDSVVPWQGRMVYAQVIARVD